MKKYLPFIVFFVSALIIWNINYYTQEKNDVKITRQQGLDQLVNDFNEISDRVDKRRAEKDGSEGVYDTTFNDDYKILLEKSKKIGEHLESNRMEHEKYLKESQERMKIYDGLFNDHTLNPPSVLPE